MSMPSQSPQVSAGLSTVSSNEADTVASMYQVYHAAKAIQRWWRVAGQAHYLRAGAAATTIQRQYRVYVARSDLRVALKALIKSHRRQARRQVQPSKLLLEATKLEGMKSAKCVSWRATVWIVVMACRWLKWHRRKVAVQTAAHVVQRQFRVHGRRKAIAAGMRLILLHNTRQLQAKSHRGILAAELGDRHEPLDGPTGVVLDCVDRWDTYTDPETGAPYLYNPATGETKWMVAETAHVTVQVDQVSDDGDYVISGLGPTTPSPTTPDPSMEIHSFGNHPDEMWTQATDGNGCVYYYNPATNATSWDSPAGRWRHQSNLSEGWQTFANEDGVPFYYNASTGETTWTLPPM
ncbi:hypothetical protein H310_08451 [Aphanomyces invadans]|uniref:WW domain-containing protein n=1 Tax=Aphanomyces invadans TaxID=157072 RepID=A0A024TXU7_9STRA|nr:hypothetical protein H310_08451 [Aphanomyces invadans]ETV98975.1 hypothetical protein H310_08451 [Aphanomyces invadans]|eukprot:XP_008872403.1 hypothetical protein H310_08451 [Aphanomyces invadans]